MQEWSNKNYLNSFNSEVKGLTYYEYFLSINDWRLGKRDKPLPPIEISLDPIHACNLKCSWCVEENEIIIKLNGKNKKAKEVAIGDILLSFDEKNKKISETLVHKIFSREVNHYLYIELDNGYSIKTTEEHPFYKDGKWIIAKNLKIGDNVMVITNKDKSSYVSSKRMKNNNPSKNIISQQKIITTKRKNGVYVKSSELMKKLRNNGYIINSPMSEENKRKASNRMKLNNPMFKQETRNKVSNTTSQKIKKGEIIPFMCNKEGKEILRKISIRRMSSDKNPMKNEMSKAKRLSHIDYKIVLEKVLKSASHSPNKLETFFLINAPSIVKEKIGEKNTLGIRIKRTNKLRFPDFIIKDCSANIIKVIELGTINQKVPWAKTPSILENMILDYNSNNIDCLFISQEELYENPSKTYRKVISFLKETPKCLHYIKIKSIKIINEKIKVYNFECSPNNNYYTNLILVHNCNASRYLDEGLEGRRMKDEHLMNLISFLAKWGTKAICWGGGGEPTLHRKLDEGLKLSYSLGLENSIATNGTLFTDNLIDIAVLTCRWIGVSIDAGTANTYFISRNKDLFHVAINNLRKLTLKQKELKTNCDIAYKFLIFQENQHEIYKACELAKLLGVNTFHARPASYSHQGMKETIENPYDMKLIEEEFKRCHELEDNNFNVYTVIHKFNPDFSTKRNFKQCWVGPICIQLCADGNIYNCPDSRHLEYFKLGEHYPNPENIEKIWGNKKHYDLVFNGACKICNWRCTFGYYNNMFEDLFINNSDPLCRNFV